jgi:iron complex outermembrane receptor protein
LGGELSLEAQVDFTRGWLRSDSSSLPRMPPLRESLRFEYRKSGWLGAVELQRSEAQNQVAARETRTAAFHLLNAAVEAPLETSFASFRLNFKVNNILDQEARVHTSLLKDVAPLPGRNFIFELQAAL